MRVLLRALKALLALVILAGVVLWFEARRGDRGYIEEEVTIDRPAPTVFRWITTDDLLRRWISGLITLQRTAPAGPPSSSIAAYRIDEEIANRRVALDMTVIRATQNQQLDLSVRPAVGSAGVFFGTANFKLYPEGEYTRLVFTSQTSYQTMEGQIFEPVITYAVKMKIADDLTRLKNMMEAEPAR